MAIAAKILSFGFTFCFVSIFYRQSLLSYVLWTVRTKAWWVLIRALRYTRRRGNFDSKTKSEVFNFEGPKNASSITTRIKAFKHEILSIGVLSLWTLVGRRKRRADPPPRWFQCYGKSKIVQRSQQWDDVFDDELQLTGAWLMARWGPYEPAKRESQDSLTRIWLHVRIIQQWPKKGREVCESCEEDGAAGIGSTAARWEQEPHWTLGIEAGSESRGDWRKERKGTAHCSVFFFLAIYCSWQWCNRRERTVLFTFLHCDEKRKRIWDIRGFSSVHCHKKWRG